MLDPSDQEGSWTEAVVLFCVAVAAFGIMIVLERMNVIEAGLFRSIFDFIAGSL